MSLRRVGVVTALVVAFAGIGTDTQRFGGRSPVPVPAVAAVLRLFERVPVVALGEAHGLLQQHEFLQALVRNPEFPASVGVIVVEFGNPLHQEVVDRYLNGENVAPAELRQVWRNTAASPMIPWDSPIYEAFFSTVRTVNQSLPPERRLRVVAGEAPIDWTRATRADVFHWSVRRDSSLASAVITSALERGRNALLIAGTLHVTRRPAAREGGVANAVQLIEDRYPGSTYVVAVHTGFGTREYELAPRFRGWPTPSIAALRGTWFGALEAGLFFGDNILVALPGAGAPPPNPWSGLTLGEVVDATLYLGDANRLTVVVPSPLLYRDEAYFAELNRRSLLRSGRPLPAQPQFYRFGVPLSPTNGSLAPTS